MVKMTFESLATIEPRLLQLYNEARCIKPEGRNFCANEVWYKQFKPRLLRLVGWEAENPLLATAEAYEISYKTIYDALPDCRVCSCI